MIFVTLGTQDKGFPRLLEAIEEAIENKYIKEKVIVQAGYTEFESKNMEIYKLLPMDKFDDYMKKCDLLITHAGVGSIMSGLKFNKKIIAAPRLEKYGEHTNDHHGFKELGIEHPDIDRMLVGLRRNKGELLGNYVKLTMTDCREIYCLAL